MTFRGIIRYGKSNELRPENRCTQAENREKTEELKNLKAEVAKLEEAKVKFDFKTLNEYLAGKGIAPDEALAKLKEQFGE